MSSDIHLLSDEAFDLAQVRRVLHQAEPNTVVEAEVLRDYRQYYGLVFENYYPEVRHEFRLVQSGPYHLAMQVFTQPAARGNLLLVHGYFDHVGLYGRLISYGLSRGMNVVAFDLPGHGLSTGEPAVIEDFSDYSAAITDCLQANQTLAPQPWYCIAQSTGGAAMMQLLLDLEQHPFRSVVLLAPLVRPRGWWWVRLMHRLIHRFRDYVPRSFAQNSQDGLFLEFLRRDPLQARHVSTRWVGALKAWLRWFEAQVPPLAPCPILIVQGTGDETVEWEYNLKRLSRLFPESKCVMIEGARHHLANETVHIREQIAAEMDAFFRVRSIIEATAPPDQDPL